MFPRQNAAKTVYINPKFKNAHINPNFLKVQQSQTIHINPAFIQKNAQQSSSNPTGLTNVSPALGSNFQAEKTYTSEPSAKIITKNRTKLVRESRPVKTMTTSIVCPNPMVKIGSKKLVRATHIHEPSAISKSKARIIQQSILFRMGTPSLIKAKYKIDRRIKASVAQSLTVGKLKRGFVTKYKLRRSNSFSDTLKAQKVTLLNTRELKINHQKTTHAKLYSNKSIQLLRINGVLYKSTGKKLLKTVVNPPDLTKSDSSKSRIPVSITSNPERTLFVRGDKFILDKSGCSLTRVQNTDNMKLKRIDIGGLTYIAQSPNLFVRTNNHKTRTHLSNAKQKSITLLSRNMVKSNLPCPIYRKVGKCAAYERGKCPKVHDRKQISICLKYLKGECLTSNCLLSHDISLSKMPTCRFFLQGLCVRDECPYLHKKVNEKTDICLDFLRGFCQLAEKCNRRHEYLCPDYDTTGTCKKVKCPYPHKKESPTVLEVKNINKIRYKRKTDAETMEGTSEPISKEDKYSRYFNRKSESTETQKPIENVTNISVDSEKDDNKSISSDDTEIETTDNEEQQILIKRPKLGELPAFIPL